MQKLNMADEIIEVLQLLNLTKEQVLEKDVQELAEWLISMRILLAGFILGKYKNIDLIPEDETFDDIAKEIIDKLSKE